MTADHTGGIGDAVGCRIAGRTQQQCCAVNCPARYDDNTCAKNLNLPVARYLHPLNPLAIGRKHKPLHIAVRDDLHTTGIEGRLNQACFGIVFGAQLAGKSIAGFATDAVPCGTEVDGYGKRGSTGSVLTHRIGHPRNQRLGRELRCGIRLTAPRRTGVTAVVPMHVKDGFCFAVVRLNVSVAKRPCRRNTFFMLEHAEVFFAEANHATAVELGTAANVVVNVGTERFALAVQPAVVGGVLLLVEYGPDAPVVGFTRDPVTPLEHQHVNPVFGQAAGNRPTADSAADYDNVGISLHDDFEVCGVSVGWIASHRRGLSRWHKYLRPISSAQFRNRMETDAK